MIDLEREVKALAFAVIGSVLVWIHAFTHPDFESTTGRHPVLTYLQETTSPQQGPTNVQEVRPGVYRYTHVSPDGHVFSADMNDSSLRIVDHAGGGISIRGAALARQIQDDEASLGSATIVGGGVVWKTR